MSKKKRRKIKPIRLSKWWDNSILYRCTQRITTHEHFLFESVAMWRECYIVQQTESAIGRHGFIVYTAKINSANCRLPTNPLHLRSSICEFNSTRFSFFLLLCSWWWLWKRRCPCQTKIPILFIRKFTCRSTKPRLALEMATQQNRFTSNSDKVCDSSKEMIFFPIFFFFIPLVEPISTLLFGTAFHARDTTCTILFRFFFIFLLLLFIRFNFIPSFLAAATSIYFVFANNKS